MAHERYRQMGWLLLSVVFFPLIILLNGVVESGTAVSPQTFTAENTPDGWQVECIECLHYFTGMSGSSAALDSADLVHTAYGGDSLYYAVQNPDNTFQIEVVDDNPYRGLNATMVLDSNDRPHILYYAGDLQRLNYARFDGGQWQIATLPTADLTMSPNPWLVIDSNDFLHVVYNENDSDVVYGRYDQNSWNFSVVDSAGTVPIGHPVIALDSSDRPHIAYASGQKYAFFNGVSWQITTFPDTFNYGEHAAIALDDYDKPYIALQADTDGGDQFDLLYRFKVESDWKWEMIEEARGGHPGTDFVGDGITLLFDATNQPIVTYSGVFVGPTWPYPDFHHHDLRMAYRDANGWQVLPRFNNSYTIYDRNYSTSLIGPGNKLSIVTKDGPDLKLIEVDGEDRSYYYIDRGGSTGTHHDMTADHENRLHISLHEAELDHLRYGVREDDAWMIQTLSYNIGFLSVDWKSLALSKDSRPYIMYDVYNRGGLTFAYFDGQNWTGQKYPFDDGHVYDVAVDQNNYLHVTFYRGGYGSTHDLKYAVWYSDRNWSEFKVLDPNLTDGMLDMALDSADFPHISYPSENGLGYAVETPSGWTTSTIASGVISDTTIALDQNDHPHIAWYDSAVQELKYAAYNGSAWQFKTVDSSGDVGRHASIAVDNLGRVYIAYYNATNQDLKYATFDGTFWSTTTLLSTGEVGAYAVLAMPYEGYPAIAYFNAATRDLMLIYRPFEPTNFAYAPIMAKD